MGEFELIRRYFQPVARAAGHPAIVLGAGDDCAIQRIEPGYELVFSMDTLVEGVHFPPDYSPEHLGWRSLAVAASDIAAMGGDPVCFTLALTLPEAQNGWLEGFSRGLSQAAKSFGLMLAGGDTTRGPLALTLQVHGVVPEGQAIRRAGARPGDAVCVSGTLGDAGAALDYLALAEPDAAQLQVLLRYHRPEPRLELGRALRPFASAAIDISDGLLADLNHILEASGVGAIVDTDAIPVSDALRQLRPDALDLALRAGDDYELCVTVPRDLLEAMPEDVRRYLKVIGEVSDGKGVSLSGYGKYPERMCSGYDHFGN